jgi:hypothetical protein
MQTSNEPIFDAPIPGMSLTHELGDRPWQTPAKHVNVDEVMDYYMERMSNEEFMVQVVEVLESGVPVTVLANTIQMASVMDGVHSLDTGMLVLPMIMEMMMMLAESADIEYDDGLKDPNKKKTRDSLVAKVISQYEKRLEDKDIPDMERFDNDLKKDLVPDKATGLMSRRPA